MKLTGEERRVIHRALLDAFPARAQLARMLSFELNENLEAVAAGDTLGDIVFNLISWAESRDEVALLVLCANRHNPGNAALRKLARLMGSWSKTGKRELTAEVDAGVAEDDVDGASWQRVSFSKPEYLIVSRPFPRRETKPANGDKNIRIALRHKRILRVWVHKAYFAGDSREHYFVNLTNLSPKRALEVTHVWFEYENKHIPVIQRDRMLPVRLEVEASWEIWFPVDAVPADVRQDTYKCFRARTSDGSVFSSTRNEGVPPFGTVPGGPIVHL